MLTLNSSVVVALITVGGISLLHVAITRMGKPAWISSKVDRMLNCSQSLMMPHHSSTLDSRNTQGLWTTLKKKFFYKTFYRKKLQHKFQLTLKMLVTSYRKTGKYSNRWSKAGIKWLYTPCILLPISSTRPAYLSSPTKYLQTKAPWKCYHQVSRTVLLEIFLQKMRPDPLNWGGDFGKLPFK